MAAIFTYVVSTLLALAGLVALFSDEHATAAAFYSAATFTYVTGKGAT
jgi:hypothetical protein